MPKKPHVHLAAGLSSQQQEKFLGMWQFCGMQGGAAMTWVMPVWWPPDSGDFRNYHPPVWTLNLK